MSLMEPTGAPCRPNGEVKVMVNCVSAEDLAPTADLLQFMLRFQRRNWPQV